MITPTVVTLSRLRQRPATNVSLSTWRRRQREFTQRESVRWLVIELVVFGLLAAISIWPMLQAVAALRLL